MLWPITGIGRLIKGKTPKIEYTEGNTIRDVPGLATSRHVIEVYIKVLFRLLEFMLLDVAAGYTVYFDKKRNSRFFVVFLPVGENYIKGKGLKATTSKVNLKITKYKEPRFGFDPGYAGSTPTQVIVPEYIHDVLIEEVNEGRKYARPLFKKFLSELTEEEKEVRIKAWEKKHLKK